MKRLHVIDSHTGGEPTRLVMSGFPTLTGSTLAEQLENLRSEHDEWRRPPGLHLGNAQGP